MARSFKFKSDVSISIFDGGETEFTLLVDYDFTMSEPTTYEEPGHEASVEITDIRLVSSALQPLITPGWFDAMVRADESFAHTLVVEAIDIIETEREDALTRRYEEREVAF